MKDLSADEETSPDVTGVYSISKYAHERMALALGRECGIPVVALRYALTFGPRQSLFNPYTGIYSIVSMQILSRKRLMAFEDGLQTRDFTFVLNVADANYFVMQLPKADNEVFDVGTGIATSVREFACTLARLYGNPELEPYMPNEFRPLDLRNLFTDNAKLKGISWQPRHTRREGLARNVECIRSQRRPETYLEQALAELRKVGMVKGVTV